LIIDAAAPSADDRARAHTGPLLALFASPVAIENDRVAAVLERASTVLTTERSLQNAEACGAGRPRVLPLAADPAYWDRVPDRALMEALSDGKVTLLFAGPLGEGSGAADVIAAFSFLIAMHCDARVVFVNDAAWDADADAFAGFVERHGLTPRVTIEAPTTPERLAAYYRSASLYFTMSERDDSLGALIDAMLFDVPIVAFGTPLVRDVLGPAGIIVSSRSDPAKLGALARELIRDERLRRAVIAAQRARRSAYDRHLLDGYVEGLAGALRPISITETA
jgi:glycosyltransferase involved in cell wall biosynthesis